MANAARYKPRLIAPAFRGEHPARAQAQLPRLFPPSDPAKSHLSALPATASSPQTIPAGRPAGSARTRSRVQTLENPFLGSSVRFPPRLPSPKTPQADGPCSWAIAVLATLPPTDETKQVRPCSWGARAATPPAGFARIVLSTAICPASAGTRSYIRSRAIYI